MSAYTDRPELQDCPSRLGEGDTLRVHSIDRLARSLQDLQNIISQLIAKGVTVKFVKEKKFLAAGMSGYVAKPVNMESLIHSMDKTLAEQWR